MADTMADTMADKFANLKDESVNLVRFGDRYPKSLLLDHPTSIATITINVTLGSCDRLG